jgi:hypothetical protein
MFKAAFIGAVLLFRVFGTDQCWEVFSAVGVAPDVVGDVQVGQLDVGVGRADDVGGGVDAWLPLASGRRRTARSQCAPHHRRGPRQHFILVSHWDSCAAAAAPTVTKRRLPTQRGEWSYK